MKNAKAKLPWGLLPTIIALAWPTMLEQLLGTAVQYIDTAMVGSLGTSATAAVGSTTTVNWLIGSTVSALGVGILSYVAKAFGAGEDKKAKRAAGQAVFIVLVAGAFFTFVTLSLSNYIPVWMQVDENIRDIASDYFFILYAPMLFRTASIIFGTLLRAAGDAKTPMLSGVAVNFINVVLNFFLIYPTRNVTILGKSITIYGADMGVIGAATASAVSIVAGGVIMTAVLLCHKRISPKGQRILPDREILLPCLRVAFPNMLQRFGTSLGYVAFAAMINSIGEVATAAHTVANTIESAFYIPGYGMQTAAATLAGNAAGAGDRDKYKSLRKMMLPIEVLLMFISGGLLFTFAPMLVSIFSKSQEVMTLGTTVLKMVAVSEPFYGVAIILEGMLQGIGDTKKPFIYNIIGMWGIRIVGTFICTQILSLGLISAWGCMILHNLLLCLLFSVNARKSDNKISKAS